MRLDQSFFLLSYLNILLFVCAEFNSLSCDQNEILASENQFLWHLDYFFAESNFHTISTDVIKQGHHSRILDIFFFISFHNVFLRQCFLIIRHSFCSKWPVCQSQWPFLHDVPIWLAWRNSIKLNHAKKYSGLSRILSRFFLYLSAISADF